MKKILFKFFCILILSLPVFADDSLIQIKQKLERIEREISDLQKILFTKNDKKISKEIENENTNSKITVFDMRLRDIENELQAINLNYENISFDIEDLKNVLEELTLELNDAILKLNNSILTINTKISDKANNNSENENEIELKNPDELTQSQNKAENTLGTLKISSTDLSESKIIDETDKKNIYSSPKEQFQVAFDNLRAQKFELAKSDLQQFIIDHPSDILAGSAHYWLGEIYFLKKEYREAALVFAEGYQKYPDSVKSPESLFKLALTLIKIEKNVEACNTLRQLILKYPKNKLVNKSQAKINEIQCS